MSQAETSEPVVEVKQGTAADRGDGKPRRSRKTATSKGSKRPNQSRDGDAKSVRSEKAQAARAARPKGRRERQFPSNSFQDALGLATTLIELSPGGKIRLLTLLEKMDRSPGSSATRDLITNASKYGLVVGSYKSEHLELTAKGKIACDPAGDPRQKRRAQFGLAVEHVAPFKALFDAFVGKRLPAKEVMRDLLLDNGIQEFEVEECVDLFIVNLNGLGVLRTIAGAETIVPIDQVLESLATTSRPPAQMAAPRGAGEATSAESTEVPWDKLCFYITPIGEESSERRQHADLIMGSIIEPALREIGLKVVRADQIGSPGMITTQIMEHIKRCKLAVADFSFLNPNVFYETALRHALRLPVLHVIRRQDALPFDVGQMRATVIDTSTIYTLVPKIPVHVAEIATQARKAIEDPESCANPVSIFFPSFWDNQGKQ